MQYLHISMNNALLYLDCKYARFAYIMKSISHFSSKSHKLDQYYIAWECKMMTFLQKTNMFSQFESVDPESDHHWNEKVNNWLKEFQV